MKQRLLACHSMNMASHYDILGYHVVGKNVTMSNCSSWSCPCHNWMVFDKFSRFKENVKARHPCHWCDLKRGRSDVTIGAGDKYFFLFRRMKCFLVNRRKGTAWDTIFVTNLTVLSKDEEVPYWMSVRYTGMQNSTVCNRIDTLCLKHWHNNGTEYEPGAFVACPSAVLVKIHIVVGREAGRLRLTP